MQTYVDRKNFSFFSKALGEDVFEVVKFSGREAISQPYEFSITLSARDSDIDLKWLLRNPATLIILRGGEPVPISGVLASFEQLHEANHRAFYRAALVPKLWYLGLCRENRLFLNKSVPQILDETLKQSGLSSADYELKLTRSYPAWEYICQYAESNLEFISRWMEREGIYYFFKQTLTGEKLVITDNSSVHEGISGTSLLPYTPTAGLVPEVDEVVTGLVCRQRVLPKKVILKDYNYRKPTLDVRAEAVVDPNGREEVYIYGEHFKDPSQGRDLASVRAGEFLCRETVYYGQATSPRLAPGFMFELAGHYRVTSNRKFLITEVAHQGMATGVLLAGLGDEERDPQPGYSCSFACIPSDVQFRPERKTPRPRINGMMNAVIDAAGDGSTAELDDQGRYKVILPFDLSGRNGGRASRWVRMAQPYSGSDYGMHFPLHKGAEVLLTFIDGDIDRPVISGAVPNPNTQSPVTNANQSKSVIRDNYGNEIVMDATSGDEHILIHSPHHKSTLELGKSGHFYTESDKSDANLGNRYNWGVGGSYSFFFGPAAQFNSGVLTGITLALNNNLNIGGTHQIDVGYNAVYSAGPRIQVGGDVASVSNKHNIVTAKDTLCLIGGAANMAAPGKPDNTSIICADEDRIRLTVGKKVQPIEPTLDTTDKALLGSAVALSALVSTILASFRAQGPDRQKLVGFSGGALSLGAIAASIFAAKRVLFAKSNRLKDIVDQKTPAAEIEIKKEGDINISSNGKRVGGNYHDRVMVGAGENANKSSRVVLVEDEIAIETQSNSNIKAAIYLTKDRDLNMLAGREMKMEIRRAGIKLSGCEMKPIKRTEINWPNLQVKW